MADTNIQVENDEEGVVTVDVSNLDLPEPTLQDLKDAATGNAQQRVDQLQQRTEPQQQRAAGGGAQQQTTQQQQPAAADEAAAALTNAMQATENERKARLAAEQTAAAERRRAEEATRRAQSATAEADQFRDQAFQGQLNSIDSVIQSASTDLEAAKQEYQRAFEAGEAAKMADAQVRMAKATSKIEISTSKKADIEAAITRGAAQQQQRQPGGNQDTSPAAVFERYVSQYPARAQMWLRAHPEYVPSEVGGDPKKNAAMMKSHYAAIEAGAVEGSDDYFRVIEETLGMRQPAQQQQQMSAAATVTPAASGDGAQQQQRTQQQQPAQTQQQQQRRPQPSAPVSRDAPDGSGAPQSMTVRLNADQRDAARFSYPQKRGEDEDTWLKRAYGTYAKEYLKAQAEGKIGRATH